MGIFGLFKPEDPSAPISGSQIAPLTIAPHSAPLPTVSAAPPEAVAQNSPGVTLPSPTPSDTPLQPLAGLNVSQPVKKD